MWTKEHRRIFWQEGNGYPSDLKDAEWARLEPLIPEASPGGRPRKTDMRAAMNAILYLLRTGCPRWVVERTFSRFGRNRRLAKDFETLAETLATFVTLVSIQLAVRRLTKA
jgi:transposase